MPCYLEQQKIRHAGELVNRQVFWLVKEIFETGALCYLHLVFQNLYPLDQDPESFEYLIGNNHMHSHMDQKLQQSLDIPTANVCCL